MNKKHSDKDYQLMKDKNEAQARLNAYAEKNGLPQQNIYSPTDQMDDMISDYRRKKRRQPKNMSDGAWFALKEVTRSRNEEAITGNFDPIYTGQGSRTLSLALVGLIIIICCLLSNVPQVKSAQRSKQLMNDYTPIEGSVQIVQNKYNYYIYELEYIYEYEGESYKRSCRIDRKDAAKFGFTDETKETSSVTVYVDPKDPQRSLITTKPYPHPASWLPIPIGAVIIIISVKKYISDTY